jgi:BioD-like phosphotransacetylase family protein
MLSKPTLRLVLEELRAEPLNDSRQLNNLVDDVVVGAMGVENAVRFFRRGVLLITPGDREDIILAAAASQENGNGAWMSGIVLTGNLRPAKAILSTIRTMRIPVLLAKEDSYEVASKVHDLTVKTGPDDKEKIELIRDLIAKHVDVNRILKQVT